MDCNDWGVSSFGVGTGTSSLALARDGVGSVAVAGGLVAGPHAIDMIVDLLMVGGTHDDAAVAVADFAEDGGETEAENDGNEYGAKVVGHDAFENHVDRRGAKCYTSHLFFFEDG